MTTQPTPSEIERVKFIRRELDRAAEWYKRRAALEKRFGPRPCDDWRKGWEDEP